MNGRDEEMKDRLDCTVLPAVESMVAKLREMITQFSKIPPYSSHEQVIFKKIRHLFTVIQACALLVDYFVMSKQNEDASPVPRMIELFDVSGMKKIEQRVVAEQISANNVVRLHCPRDPVDQIICIALHTYRLRKLAEIPEISTDNSHWLLKMADGRGAKIMHLQMKCCLCSKNIASTDAVYPCIEMLHITGLYMPVCNGCADSSIYTTFPAPVPGVDPACVTCGHVLRSYEDHAEVLQSNGNQGLKDILCKSCLGNMLLKKQLKKIDVSTDLIGQFKCNRLELAKTLLTNLAQPILCDLARCSVQEITFSLCNKE